MRRILMVLSGGMDSTVCLFRARKVFNEVHAVTFDYEQRHNSEVESAIAIGRLAGVNSHEIIKLPEGILESSSPLVSNVPLTEYSDFEAMIQEVGKEVENTFVPMRNLLFLTLAANRALVLGCDTIGIGVCAADTANYPDCTERFLDRAKGAINAAIGISDWVSAEGLQIYAPLLKLSKPDTVTMAHADEECWKALAYTTTSYDGKFPPTHKNHANILRAKAFEVSGLPDPLVLRAHSEGLMELPETKNYEEFRTWHQL